MRRRKARVAPGPAPVPLVEDKRVTVAHNTDIKMVALIFGDPLGDNPLHFTFAPTQAREVGRWLLEHADKAEGK